MSNDRPLDPITRAWLDLMPDEAPDRAIASVLQAVAVTPQERPSLGRSLRRSPAMTRLTFIAAAAAALTLVVGGLWWSSQRAVDVVGPSASAVVEASPSASAPGTGATIPVQLQHEWLGPPRDVGGFPATPRTRITFSRASFSLSTDHYTSVLPSRASVPEAQQLRLETVVEGAACDAGDVGLHGFRLSPGGQRLTITPGDDDCAARRAAVDGTWFLSNGCKGNPGGCLGILEPGEYPSLWFDPRLEAGQTYTPVFGATRYTVPAGWASAEDWPNNIRLTPQEDYAEEDGAGPPAGVYHSIYVFARPAAHGQQPTCAEEPVPGVGTSAQELVDWLAQRDGLDATGPQPIAIGGASGWWMDVAVDPTWTGTCPFSEGVPDVPLLVDAAGGDEPWSWGVVGQERQRVILLDIGQDDTVGIVIDSTYPDRFDDLVADAMPIVESFRFE